MEPIDYNNKLAKVRKDYRSSLKNMRQEQEDHINQLDRAHKYQRQKQRETYDSRIQEFEDQNRDANTQFTKKTKEVIQRKNDELKTRLADEKRTFERDNQGLREDLTKRLDVLKDSFRRSKDQMKKNYDRSTEQNSRLTKDRIAHAYDQNDKVVKNLVDTHRQASEKLNEKSKAEKNRIIRKHKAEIGKQVDEDSAARKRMNRGHQEEVTTLRDNYREKLGLSQQHYMDQVNRLKTKNTNEKENQTEAYESLAQISTDRNNSEVRRAKEATEDDMRTLKKSTERQLREIKRSTHDRITSAEDENISLSQKNRRLEEKITKSDKEHRKELDGVKQSQLRKLKIANDDFANQLRDRSRIGTEALEKKDYEFHKKLNKLNSKFRDGQEGLVSKYRTEITDLNKYYTEKSSDEQRINNKILYNQRKDFGTAIKMITDKNERYVKEMQDSYADERRDLMNKAKEDVYQRSMEVREELGKRFGAQQKQLERKLDIKERENYKSEMKYGNKIDTLKNKFMDEINQQQQMEIARREAERKDIKKMIEGLNEEHYRQLVEIKNNFDKEMLRSKNINAIKREELVAGYEKRLRQNHIQAETKFKNKMAEARGHFDQMKNDYETRLQSLKSQYELRIEKLQQANIQRRSAENLAQRSLS